MRSLDSNEVKQRVAILTRLKKLLVAQREKFSSYLDVLEHQKTDIVDGDLNKLEAHVELERTIVKEIYALKKVIDPLEDMYRMAYPLKEAEPEVPAIKESLERIREEVLSRNKHNQELLSKNMAAVRQKVKGIRSFRRLAGIVPSEPAPSFIDTTA
ncbi:MAG: flagellar export chaperone FlgN [Spirochaetales bacterium]|nr:flagellar export chaperone FlgN [Spirochaetales bacterium]